MKNIVSGFITMILLTVCVLVSFSFISANLQISTAQQVHQTVVAELESSDYTQAIVDKVLNNSNYPTRITMLDIYADRRMVRIETDYEVSVPFLGILKKGTLTSYGR